MRLVRTLTAAAMILSFAAVGMAAVTPDRAIPWQLVRGGGGGHAHAGGFHGGHVREGGWGHHHGARYDGYPYTYGCPYPYHYNYGYCGLPNG